MAANYSILAWRIPWIEEPGGLQSAHKHVTQKQKKRKKEVWAVQVKCKLLKYFYVCLNYNTYSSLLITVIHTQLYRTINADPESFPFLGTKDVNNSLKRISYVKINISKELVQCNLLLLVQSDSVTLNLSLQISFSCANVSKSLMAY